MKAGRETAIACEHLTSFQGENVAVENMIVEGELVQAGLRSSFMGQTIYQPMSFRLADGRLRQFSHVVVADRMRDRLKPGMSGRFYMQRFMGRTMIQAVRSGNRTLFA